MTEDSPSFCINKGCYWTDTFWLFLEEFIFNFYWAKMFLYTETKKKGFYPLSNIYNCICNWKKNLQLKNFFNINVNSCVFKDHTPIYMHNVHTNTGRPLLWPSICRAFVHIARRAMEVPRVLLEVSQGTLLTETSGEVVIRARDTGFYN